jgi:hypothetical protein
MVKKVVKMITNSQKYMKLFYYCDLCHGKQEYKLLIIKELILVGTNVLFLH